MKIPIILLEQMGLIGPLERSECNLRRYTKDGLSRLSFICHLRDLGFSFEPIKSLLELSLHPEKPCQDAHGNAVQHLQKVQKRITKLRRLERDLRCLSSCDTDKVANCAVIETLADHGICETEH